MDNLREYVKCDLCGSENDYDIVYEADKTKILTEKDLVDKFRSSGDEKLIDRMVKCRNCGLSYLSPRIRQDLITTGYSEGEDSVFASQSEGREKTFRRCLKYLEKFTKERGTLLDVGTANGSFVYVAKQAGWSVYACEMSKYLCAWARDHYQIKVQQGTIHKQNYPTDFFSLLTLFDVIEHTTSPMDTLSECNRVMKDGAILAVNFPDLDSWVAQIMKRRWVLLLSVHLYYFNKRTITKMLEKNGFEIISIKPHWQSLSLKYLVKRMKEHSKILHLLGKIFVKLTFTGNLQVKYNIGQSLAIAKKVK